MRKLGGIVSLVLLVAAVVLFILATLKWTKRGWMVSAGLACFAGSFLAAQTL